MTTTYDADELGFFGETWGGRFMPEALVAALDELTEAWQQAMADAAFVAEFEPICHEYAGIPSLLYDAERLSRAGRRPDPAQARGPQPHRRPQDPQRARPGAADQADGQDPGHRRDRRRPARRRQRDGRGLLRPRLHRLHGRGRHPAPGAQRRPHAAARRQGRPGRLRQRDPQGRHQRGAARLGRQRRPHGLPLRHRRRPAPVPEHGARLHAAASATRPGPSASSSTARCRTPSPPASAAAPTRSACSPRSSTTTTVAIYGFEPGGDGVETGRHAATIHAGDSGVLHGARTYVLQDDDGQTIESHSISAGLDYPGVGPQHAHLAAIGRATYPRSPTPRRWRRWRCSAAPRASSRPSSPPTRWPVRLEVAGGSAGEGPGRDGPDQPVGSRRQGHGHRHRVVRPRRRRGGSRGGPPDRRRRAVSASVSTAFDTARAEGRAALVGYLPAGFPDVAGVDRGAAGAWSTPAATSSRSGCPTATR